MAPKRNKRSKVWLHFTRKDDNRASCNACKVEISSAGGNTSNMQKHLRTQHGITLTECFVFDQLRNDFQPSNSSDVSMSSAVSTADDHDKGTGSEAGSVCSLPLASPFTEAGKAKMTQARVDECHRAVTKFVVKGLHPFATVDALEFREMTKILNPKYKAPNRDSLTNHFSAWYAVENGNMISELKRVSKAAITADGWTSFSQDHYLTVTLHFVRNGQAHDKVLKTKAVYQAQTGTAVAEEIDEILEEYGVRDKVVAATVDNAANMDVAVKKLQIVKFPCFAHTLNLGAQKLYNCTTISNWAARIRSVIVWMKRSHMAKVVLTEKQELLKLPKHMLLLDVKTRWNSLYLMIERFCEQFPAIQAAAIDPRIRKPMEKERLARMGNEDLRKAEEFVLLMRKHYTSTLAVSSDKSPTCGEILPILQKLQRHYTVLEDDSAFTRTIKEDIWKDLSKRYQEAVIQRFLEEATILDPRFKSKVDKDEVWDRIREAAVAANTEAAADKVSEFDNVVDCSTFPLSQSKKMHRRRGVKMKRRRRRKKKKRTMQCFAHTKPPPVKQKKTALEELFEEEDNELQSFQQRQPLLSLAQRVDQEIQLYRSMPPIPCKDNAILWWWNKRDTLPLLSGLAEGFLCVQASSTPSERVFSTAGDTISPERSRILPEKADMLIFLQKNC
ncbi:Zinc finger BED domain-containing protein 1 [Merluccius polli]|uniref:Zinc finger BED domain-containing protein 1 n=1 Tax=Merluccius polli TaxID=89951 RepID=A0AA47PAV5_MERPO|nr:Zinc finger BED domain-containing protein 1 [Merluccius polli]